MERKIGEIFEYNGEWYQCVKSVSCGECAFLNSICIDNPSIKCSADDRNDNCSVIFKKLEKVGEPYEFDGIYFNHTVHLKYLYSQKTMRLLENLVTTQK